MRLVQANHRRRCRGASAWETPTHLRSAPLTAGCCGIGIGSMSNSFHRACPFLSLFHSNFCSLGRTHPTDGHEDLFMIFFTAGFMWTHCLVFLWIGALVGQRAIFVSNIFNCNSTVDVLLVPCCMFLWMTLMRIIQKWKVYCIYSPSCYSFPVFFMKKKAILKDFVLYGQKTILFLNHMFRMIEGTKEYI